MGDTPNKIIFGNISYYIVENIEEKVPLSEH